MFIIRSVYIILLMVVGLFIGEFSRENIVFGVSIPLPLINQKKVRKVKVKYSVRYLSAMISSFILFLIISERNSVYIIVYVIVWLCIVISLFSLANREMKNVKIELKAEYGENNSKSNKRHAVLWDLDALNKNLKKAFILNWVIIVFSIIVYTIGYSSIPNSIPLNYDIDGMITRFADKSIIVVYIMPAISAVVTLGVYLLMKLSLSAKKEINNDVAAQRLYIAKERLNGLISRVIASTNLLLFIVTIHGFGWVPGNATIIIISSSAMIIFLIASFAVFTLRTGFSGDRLAGFEEDKTINFNNDSERHWKMGVFYNNPDDPAIIVERRFGGGYTFNLGNFYSRLILAGILTIITLIVIATMVL